MIRIPQRGDILHIDLEPTRGREQQGKRYVLVAIANHAQAAAARPAIEALIEWTARDR